MPRPHRQRVVSVQPAVTVYKPAGVRARDLAWVTLGLDEFEAIRLIDDQGLDQDAAAGRMEVSRPTVTRILGSARAKIARAIVGGQALMIEGGPVIQAVGGDTACCGKRGRGCGCGRGLGRGKRGRGKANGGPRPGRGGGCSGPAETEQGQAP